MIHKRRDIHLKAYAKINFGLRILKKRFDGYHEIETVFLPLTLHDKIFMQKINQGLHLESSDTSLPLDESNLAAIAFNKMKERFPLDIDGGIKITIEKNIPVGGGLGGGSSDASAVLSGVCSLWDIDISREELEKIAGEIGSDVPFFIDCEPAFATGRGEALRKIDFNINKWIVLVFPNIHISSGWAYSQFDLAMRNDLNDIKSSINRDVPELKETLFNDLEAPVVKKYPIIEEIKQKLYTFGAEFALMSGSGSCVYGLFSDRGKSEKIRKRRFWCLKI